MNINSGVITPHNDSMAHQRGSRHQQVPRRFNSESAWATIVVLVVLLSTMTPTVNAIKGVKIHRPAKEYKGLGFYDVIPGGGWWLDYALSNGTLGEPLNIVISANSDPLILTKAGLDDWFLSIQYGYSFMNLTLGGKQRANLGDGNGLRNQTELLRYNYFDTNLGTLHETSIGGPHLRYWRQNGTRANSGAWFVAASVEKSLAEEHMIVPNGYDLGRDVIAGNATMRNGTLSPTTKRIYCATSELIQFLPAHSSKGINHAIATDGKVAILTVKVLNQVNGADKANACAKSSAATTRSPKLARNTAA